MTAETLQSQIEELRRRLAEAENTIDAIRGGEVDAFVVHEGDAPRIYTLQGADRPYRLLVEQMQQGAVTLTDGGDIAYCNRRFAELLKVPHKGLIGKTLADFVVLDCQESYNSLLQSGRASSAQAEAYLVDSEGTHVPVILTFSALDPESGVAIGVLLTDLTSQRSHERLRETTEQLRINEERYRTLFQSIDEGFCVLETLYDDQRGQSGLGIGLSLAKTLIDLHGGQISVESPGLQQGCRFIVRLPLLQDYVPPAEPASDASSVNAAQSPRYRILVVDDTRGIRFVLSRMLGKMGHEVREAVDGQDGYQQSLEWIPDVIFSDISMPNMNGHELAKKIRQTKSLQHIRMVALTGFGQAADRQHAIQSGFDEHIVKPVDIRIVQQLLKSDPRQSTAPCEASQP